MNGLQKANFMNKEEEYRERLKLKSKEELRAIANRFNYPLRKNGNKSEWANGLASFLDAPRRWKAISKPRNHG